MQARVDLIKKLTAFPPRAVLSRMGSERSRSTGWRTSRVIVERAGRDDVFDGLRGCPAGAAHGEVWAEFGRVRLDEDMAHNETDEGGEDRPLVSLRSLDYRRDFAIWWCGEGNVSLGAAIVVQPVVVQCRQLRLWLRDVDSWWCAVHGKRSILSLMLIGK
jgi:hypothetical protein